MHKCHSLVSYPRPCTSLGHHGLVWLLPKKEASQRRAVYPQARGRVHIHTASAPITTHPVPLILPSPKEDAQDRSRLSQSLYSSFEYLFPSHTCTQHIMAAATLRSPVTPGLTIKTDFEGCDRFPTYIDPFEDSDETVIDENSMPSSASSSPLNPSLKLAEKVREDPSRHASPQPTSVHVPTLSRVNGGNGYRVMRSATVGYVAPEFKGKAEQMKQGEKL